MSRERARSLAYRFSNSRPLISNRGKVGADWMEWCAVGDSDFQQVGNHRRAGSFEQRPIFQPRSNFGCGYIPSGIRPATPMRNVVGEIYHRRAGAGASAVGPGGEAHRMASPRVRPEEYPVGRPGRAPCGYGQAARVSALASYPHRQGLCSCPVSGGSRVDQCPSPPGTTACDWAIVGIRTRRTSIRVLA